MPRQRKQISVALDNHSFSDEIDRFVSGRVIVDNPTITDYIEHYGSKKALATHYAEYNNLKYDTARKQIERMMQKPNMRLKPETVSRLGKLQVQESSVRISIDGDWTYNGEFYRYGHFENSIPFDASQMRDIIRTTREQGNQAGIDKFMAYYGVDGLSGLSAMFAEGVKVTIS